MLGMHDFMVKRPTGNKLFGCTTMVLSCNTLGLGISPKLLFLALTCVEQVKTIFGVFNYDMVLARGRNSSPTRQQAYALCRSRGISF